ncbi:hypothetical protein Gotur_003577 [Gossypium turneri]
MKEINWDTLLLEANLPNFKDILDNEPKQVTKPPPQPCLTQNPDEEMAVSLWVGEIKKSPLCNSGDVVGVDGGDLYKQSQTHTYVDKYDTIAKKQKRDTVVRSREMKKMYVKDLEMKSRYLEGECR